MNNYKYRGKAKEDFEDIEKGDFVYGYYFLNRAENIHYIKATFDNESNGIEFIEMDIEVDPKTVGQWSGETDMDDVEIYKDDVVMIRNKKCVVGYENGAFVVDLMFNSTLRYIIKNKLKIKVISNIHDNET